MENESYYDDYERETVTEEEAEAARREAQEVINREFDSLALRRKWEDEQVLRIACEEDL